MRATALNRSFLNEAQHMTGRITHHDRLLEAERSLRILGDPDHLRRDELRSRLAQPLGERADVLAGERRLPMPESIRFAAERQRPAARRRLILEELDVRR